MARQPFAGGTFVLVLTVLPLRTLSLACLREGRPAMQARGYDDLSAGTLAWLEDAHVGTVEPEALREALATPVRALMHDGTEARLPHAPVVAEYR
jgi:hypothetical protein